MVAGPPARTTIGVGEHVQDGRATPTVETRVAATPAAMIEQAHDRRVDVGFGYFVNRQAALVRQMGPFIELGFHVWQRPWRGIRRLGPGIVRLAVHGYGELVASDVPRRDAWGGGAGMSATLEAVRFARGLTANVRSGALGVAMAMGEVGYGVQLATGYRRVDHADHWTTTLAVSIRTPSFLAAGAVSGGILR